MTPPTPLLPAETLGLTCDVTMDNKPAIHWLNPRGGRVSSGTLEQRVTSQDHGQWTCVVNETKVTVFVTVIGELFSQHLNLCAVILE